MLKRDLSDIVYQALAKALEIKLDIPLEIKPNIPCGLRPSTAIHEGIDKLFYCWIRKVGSGDIAEEFIPDKPSKYWQFTWKEKSYSNFIDSKYVKPEGIQTVSLRSKQLFSYGVFSLRAKLPKESNAPVYWFGFECDDLFQGGVIHFNWSPNTGSLYAYAGSSKGKVVMNLTEFVPADVDTAYHIYKIVVKPNMALWYIDGILRAIAVLFAGDTAYSGVIYDGSRYKLGVTQDIPARDLAVLLDIDGAPDVYHEWKDLHPWGLRVSNGSKDYPLYTPLFNDPDGSIWRSFSVSGAVTSMPLPGVGHKTILFSSNTNGQLVIELMTSVGRWYEFDTVTVTANKLIAYETTKNAYAIRVRYEPSTTPATINDATAIIV